VAELAKQAGEIRLHSPGSTAGRMLTNLGMTQAVAEQFVRVGRYASMAAGVSIALIDGWLGWESYQEGNYALTGAYAASGALTFAVTFIPNPVLFVALVATQIVIVYLSDSPLEAYLKKSRFGKGDNRFRSWEQESNEFLELVGR
jgi:uncharacterized membrane protein YhdT